MSRSNAPPRCCGIPTMMDLELDGDGTDRHRHNLDEVHATTTPDVAAADGLAAHIQ